MLQFDCIINPCCFLPLSTSTQFLWLMRNWSSFLNWKWKSQTIGNFLFLNFVLKLTIPLPYCQSVLTQMLLDLEALSVCIFVPSKKNKATYHLNTYLQAFFKNSIYSVFHWWFLVKNFTVETNFTRTLIRIKRVWLSSHKIYVKWQYIYTCYKCIWGNSRIILIELWLWGVSI